jgi:hypothetical protein
LRSASSLAQLADDFLSRITQPSAVLKATTRTGLVLALKQVLHESGALGVGFVGLAPRASGMAKIIGWPVVGSAGGHYHHRDALKRPNDSAHQRWRGSSSL